MLCLEVFIIKINYSQNPEVVSLVLGVFEAEGDSGVVYELGIVDVVLGGAWGISQQVHALFSLKERNYELNLIQCKRTYNVIAEEQVYKPASV